jgi:hypothetical protein
VIDLLYSREQMLTDLRAIGGPRMASAGDLHCLAHFVLTGGAQVDLLPGLDGALAAWFGDVPAERLRRDLLSPLKKAVGNAQKRGNRGAAGKRITVEVVVAAAGAYVEVTDEGDGFDVAGTYARFRAGDPYFEHGGSGFRKFAKTRSVVSFGDGGRVVRVRFLREEAARDGASDRIRAAAADAAAG